MTASSVSYSTLAYSDAVDDGAVPQTIVLLPTAFQSGVNVIAVEVHQYDQASSDLSFDMELTGFGYYVPILVRQPYLQKNILQCCYSEMENRCALLFRSEVW